MTPATCIFHQAAINHYKPYEFIDGFLILVWRANLIVQWIFIKNPRRLFNLRNKIPDRSFRDFYAIIFHPKLEIGEIINPIFRGAIKRHNLKPSLLIFEDGLFPKSLGRCHNSNVYHYGWMATWHIISIRFNLILSIGSYLDTKLPCRLTFLKCLRILKKVIMANLHFAFILPSSSPVKP